VLREEGGLTPEDARARARAGCDSQARKTGKLKFREDVYPSRGYAKIIPIHASAYNKASHINEALRRANGESNRKKSFRKQNSMRGKLTIQNAYKQWRKEKCEKVDTLLPTIGTATRYI